MIRHCKASKRSRAIVWAAAGFCAVTACASAQDLTELALEDLLNVEVSTASKYRQDAREAPAQVQVITADEIARYGWRTLGEALNSLPGYYLSDDRAYQYLGARGFLMPGDYSTRFLLLLNGQRLNDNVFEQAQFGTTFPVDLALVERIEVISGPGSAIYGSNALLGVINVITRDGRTRPGTQAAATVTTDGWRELRASAARVLGDDGPTFVASISHADKGARDLAVPSIGDTASGLDSGKHTRAYLSLQQSGLQLSFWGMQRDAVPPVALFGAAFNDRRNTHSDSDYGLAAYLDRRLAPDLEFSGRVAYQEHRYSGNFIYPDASAARTDIGGGWLTAEGRFVHSGIRSHKLIFGADLQQDARASMVNYDLTNGGTTINLHDREWRAGLFAQDEWTLDPAWKLSLGLRYDRYAIDLSHLSPRVGLVHAADEATTVKLLAGEAYRVPNLFERKYDDGQVYLGNAALKPEVIRTYEAIVERRIAAEQMVGVSLYYYRMKDQIDQQYNGTSYEYQNLTPFSAAGMELYWKAKFSGGGSLMASAGFSHAHRSDSEALPNSPNWLAKLRAAHPLGSERLQGALELDAIGARDVEALDGSLFRIGTQWWANAVVTAKPEIRGVTIQARVLNLFDRYVAIPIAEAAAPLIPYGGRRLQVSLVHDF